MVVEPTSERQDAAEEVLMSKSARLRTEGLEISLEYESEGIDDDDGAASDKTGIMTWWRRRTKPRVSGRVP